MKLKFLTLPAIAFVVSLSTLVALPQQAKAVSAADWKAGRIIDDAVFFNKDSMSVQQIQDFLNAKVPNCDRWNPTRFTYAGKPYGPPYTCLKEYQENPSTKENNIGRFNPDGSPYNVPGGWSAAQIIKDASMSYGINPQVLIVMLQKETAIVTDTWAAGWQYDRAMGYGCPDNGPNNTANCNASYYGFYNQVGNAAWQLKRYTTNPNEYNFKAGVTRNILWQVGGVCGSSPVYLENAATAALYNYTPYQPNQAALNNLYGTGDGCSAYGNRNFWRLFNDWFGSSIAPAFSAQLIYQSPYPTISAGQTVDVVLSYRNNGTVYWRDSRTAASFGQFPVHLATAESTNRNSWFGASWPTPSRPAITFNRVYDLGPNGISLAADQTVVHPGQIAEYVFRFTAATNTPSNTYKESFFPVREGTSSWYMGGLAWLNLTIRPTNYGPTYYRQSPYPNLKAGESTQAFFDIKNSGNTTWYDEVARPVGINPVRLATYLPINHSSMFSAKWASPTRPVINFSKVFEADGVTLAPNQHIANNGQIVRLEYIYTVPSGTNAGTYREFFTPILEGASNWNIGGVLWHDITVAQTNYNPSFAGQSNYPTITKGTSQTAFFRLKNNGNTLWYDSTSAPTGVSPMHLATANPINRSSQFGSTWLNTARPAVHFAAVFEADGVTLAPNQHIAQPGQIVQYSFTLSAPSSIQSGTYREFFMPILEGASNWDMGMGMWLDISII